jgi:GNAT superfamily N-acetyltransferase
MTRQRLQCRPARARDTDSIADVFSPSLRLLSFLPELHTVEEDRTFIANVIMRECTVMVAEADGVIVAFLALGGEEIRLLHTHPDFVGQGAGTMLLDATKATGVAALELWCFQANIGARRFYERNGFRPIRFTDGAHNEERLPDVRYRWP